MGRASKSGCDPGYLQAVTKVDTKRISLLHGFCRHVILAVSGIVIVLDLVVRPSRDSKREVLASVAGNVVVLVDAFPLERDFLKLLRTC